jgi:WD domain, G-beta repeat.
MALAALIHLPETLKAAIASSAAPCAISSSSDESRIDYEVKLPLELINKIKNYTIDPGVSNLLRTSFIAQDHDNRLFSILTATITPDGKHIITSDRNHYIKIWDAATITLNHTIIDQENNTFCNELAISKNSKTIAKRSGADNIKIWNIESGQLQATIAGTNLQALTKTFTIWRFSPCERITLNQGQVLLRKNPDSSLTASTAISPDRSFILVTYCDDREVSIYPINEGLEKALKDVSITGVQLLNNIANGNTGTARHPLTPQEQIDFDALPQNIRECVRKNTSLYEATSWTSYFTQKAYSAYDFIRTHKKIIGCVAIASALGYMLSKTTKK